MNLLRCLVLLAGLGLAASSASAAPLEVSLQFSPKVAHIGQPVTVLVSSANLLSHPVDATIRLTLEVSGVSLSVEETFSIAAGEGTCAEFEMSPELPGIIRITANVTAIEASVHDSDMLYVLPGGSESPFDDLPALGESILDALSPCGATPVESSTWGSIKSRYR